MSCRISPITIYQGATYRKLLRWGQPVNGYAAISAVTKAAPAVVTTVAPHGVPDGWPVWIESVAGMVQINRPQVVDKAVGPHYKAVVTGSTTLGLANINALDYPAYKSGGTVVFALPVDLTGLTARAQFWTSPDDAAPFLTLTSASGGVLLDNVAKTITLIVTSVQSAALAPLTSGSYELEMTDGSGAVTRLAMGPVTVVQEGAGA